MPSQTELKEIFELYDEEMDGKVDGTQLGDVARACGLKPTNAMVWKAAGQEFARVGEKRFTFDEWLPIYEKLGKEKETGCFDDFLEGLRVFDKNENGKIYTDEIKHAIGALGERLNPEQLAAVTQWLKGMEDGEGMVNYEQFIKKVMAGPEA